MRCRICDATRFSLAVDLGNQPWGNHFLKEEEVGKEPFYPLRVLYCETCKGVQLDYTVKKEVMFSDHTYLSGVTRSLREHFERVASRVQERFFPDPKGRSILDIGSNDGTLLKAFQTLGFSVLGVESSRQTASIANERGIETVHAFFNLETADRIGRSFDVFHAAGVFFHLEELHSVTEAIRKHLKPDGVFVVQFLYMKSILENGAFDQIYHEHLLFYTLHSLQELLKRHGLSLFDAEWDPIHGGTIVAYVGHAGKREKTGRLLALEAEEAASGCNELPAYRAFSEEILRMKEKSLAFLREKKEQGKRIYGMGAPVKGNTLLNTFGIGKEFLDCLVEKNRLRKGLFSPGMHLPIWIEDEIAPPDVYYVLAWNFKREILQNNQHLLEKGVEFFFPVETRQCVS